MRTHHVIAISAALAFGILVEASLSSGRGAEAGSPATGTIDVLKMMNDYPTNALPVEEKARSI